MQAGVNVSGAVHIAAGGGSEAWSDSILEDYSPLTLAEIPHFSFEKSPDWTKLLSSLHPQFGEILQGQSTRHIPPPVAIDKSSNTVTLFLPGFPKSEVKLSQVGLVLVSLTAVRPLLMFKVFPVKKILITLAFQSAGRE